MRQTIPAVYAAIARPAKGGGHEILILRRSGQNKIAVGKWQLAGGKIDLTPKNQETRLAALKREVFQETMLTIRIEANHPQRPVAVHTYKYRHPTGGNYNPRHTFVVLAHPEFEPILSREHDAMKWIREEHLGKYDFTDGTAEAIEKAFRHLGRKS